MSEPTGNLRSPLKGYARSQAPSRLRTEQMNSLKILSLSPFIPSGKDYEMSRRLFIELGFEEIWECEGYAAFRNGEARFVLREYHNEGFAQNLMVRIVVPDLDVWWSAISAKKLGESYPDFSINSPTDYPWGREANFIDLAGVCWHVGGR